MTRQALVQFQSRLGKSKIDHQANIGLRVGRLVIVEVVVGERMLDTRSSSPRLGKVTMYRAVCDCGGEYTALPSAFISKKAGSCGCMRGHKPIIHAVKTSRFKGVHFYKPYKNWRAMIKSGGKNRHLGCFEDEETAARAYDKALIEMHGFDAALTNEKLGLYGKRRPRGRKVDFLQS